MRSGRKYTVISLSIAVLITVFTSSCGIIDSGDDAPAARGFLASGGVFHLNPGLANNLFLISEDGNEITQLTDDSLLYYRAKWSPDGRWIITYGEFSFDNAFIYLIGADGSNREFLLSSAGSPVWSPDGSKIAYSSGGDVYLREIETGETTHLGAGVGGELTWDWSERYGIIVTSLRSAYTQDSSFYYRDREIYVMDLSGNMTQITSDSTKRKSGIDLSPDGENIVYVAGSRFQLHITSLSDTITRTITMERERVHSPVWNPEGTKLAFSYFEEDSSKIDGIYMLDINTEEAVVFHEYNDENLSEYGHLIILDWR